MTACPDPNRIAALVDGATPRAARLELERHLDDCAECTALVRELAWLVAPGVTLRAWRAAAPRTAAEIVAHWRAVIAQVAADHRAGVIHGSLSPDRVLATATASATDRSDLALASAVPGACSPYLAPEQLHGAPATRASDQFALCASLWEALAGRPPFRGATVGALAVAMASAPDRPTGDGVFAVLARGLAPDPADRWPDLDALLAAIDGCDRRASSRTWWVSAALAITALVAIATC